MNKKLLALMLTAAGVLTLTGCGAKNADDSATEDTGAAMEQTVPTVEETTTPTTEDTGAAMEVQVNADATTTTDAAAAQ